MALSQGVVYLFYLEGLYSWLFSLQIRHDAHTSQTVVGLKCLTLL